MNPTLTSLALLLLSLSAAAQEPGPGDEPTPAAAPAQRPSAGLHGVWIATGEDAERLEFRQGGALLVDGTELRYTVRGDRLTIVAPGRTLRGTFRIEADTLSITLQLDAGERTETYRREGGAAEQNAPRERAAGVLFELPVGWRVARRDGDAALLDPGFAPTDTLDALVLVVGGEVEAAQRRLSIVDLLRHHLRALAADLQQQGIEVDVRRANVRAAELPEGRGAEVELAGTAGGERPVTVWVGATRNDGRWMAVVAVVVKGQVDKFLPGARHVFTTAKFASEDAAEALPIGAGGALAGLEFGSSSFGSDASLTTVYRFGNGGNVQRRTMFSSPMGGSDKQTPGTFALRGDVVTIRCGEDVVEGRLERRDGGIVALRIGGARYDRLGG